MAPALQPVLLLFAAPLLLVSSDYRYEGFVYISNVTMSWQDASDYCDRHHRGLMVIKSQEQQQVLDDSGIIGWTALSRESGQWLWPDGEAPIYSKWHDDKPQTDSSKPCMELKTNGWDDKECNELRTFICADEKLILVKEQKSWEEALRHCRRLVSRSDDAVLVGYELAFLLTDDDLLLATEKAQNADTAQVWTGLRYLAASWVWVGGEVDGVPLLEACPTQDLRCGSVSQGASSEQSTQCIQENNFLCLRLDIL